MSKRDRQPGNGTEAAPRPGDTSESPVTATPLWAPGRRPFGPERRKDPAAAHRHEEARTGVAPAGATERRRPARERPPFRVVSYWSEGDD